MKKKTRILFTILLFIAVFTTGCELDIMPKTKSKVWIISVALDYRNTGGNILNGTINDAIEFPSAYTAYLDSKGIEYVERYMIATGTDANEEEADYPSESNVLKAISDIDSDPNDLILFFYSGHGELSQDESSTPSLVLGRTSNADSLYPMTPYTTVFDALAEKNCQSLAVIDACYSGGMSQDWTCESLAQRVKELFTGIKYTGVHVIAASQSDELSYEITEPTSSQPHAAFTLGILETMGWVHTTTDYRTVSSSGKNFAVKGEPSIILPSGTTIEELFDAASSNELISRQTPCMNHGRTLLKFIP